MEKQHINKAFTHISCFYAQARHWNPVDYSKILIGLTLSSHSTDFLHTESLITHHSLLPIYYPIV